MEGEARREGARRELSMHKAQVPSQQGIKPGKLAHLTIPASIQKGEAGGSPIHTHPLNSESEAGLRYVRPSC